ncbi:hypothetical protein D3Z36_05380 [Lachnospiraceae bacterium]|nr:hypothetical protein [Lachnospiraceae bacterium]
MFRKMMKHLANNPGLKLLSLLFSVVLWLMVVNVADPEATKFFSVPVEILNKDVITEMGKVPNVVGDSDIAVFYITGPRSYVEDMASDDFNVTADLSQVDLSQEGDAKLVPIEITAKKNDRRIDVVRRTVNMQITLEDRSEQKFIISAETTGTPAKGSAIGNVEVTPNLLKISGPASVVSRINRVAASINVDGISSDVSDNVMPVLYDENGLVISSDLLEINQSVVTIRAKILSTKNIPVRCQVSGTPAAGYEYRGVEYAPDSVLVKGDAAVLNGISAINIPPDVINIDGASSDVEVSIEIVPYLQEMGISLVDDTANQIAVKAIIEQKSTKKFNLPVKDIKITGLSSSYELEFSAETVPINVRALEEDMEGLKPEDIEVILDVTELQPGTYTRQLMINLPGDKYELVSQVNLQFNIVDKDGEPEDSENNSGPVQGGDSDDDSSQRPEEREEETGEETDRT